MSDESDTPTSTPAGPQPDPIPMVGTTWVDHDNGYALRRAALGLCALLGAAGGAFLLKLAYEGLDIAQVGSFISLLVVVVFSACSAVALRRTWESFSTRPDPDRQAQLRTVTAIGFIGALLAYFLRSFMEAPGEKLRRTEYETALAQYERRSARRAGNPASRKKKGKA
ncbi:EamA/RhaT family transporter [Streptomyces sp. NBC_01304]|uniref:EamA/RhaT family transporter n=1 Tax=Streptomyces sp. NBC_01304 TaxID=2903818 RepID=UPI002E0D6BC3|nr:EamA/RhaT family transporter [Streptomyces sp. NBC_01304]